MDCVFCKIGNQELPAEIVYQDEKAVVFLDISPVNKGHCLAIPKEHHANLLDTPDDLVGHLMSVVKKTAQAIQQVLGAEGVNININNGSAAGQVVFHTHIHIIPRYQQDGLKLWPGEKYKNEEEKKQITQKIKTVLSSDYKLL